MGNTASSMEASRTCGSFSHCREEGRALFESTYFSKPTWTSCRLLHQRWEQEAGSPGESHRGEFGLTSSCVSQTPQEMVHQSFGELWAVVPLCASVCPSRLGLGLVGTGDSGWDGLNLLATLSQVPPWFQDLAEEVESDGGGFVIWGLLWAWDWSVAAGPFLPTEAPLARLCVQLDMCPCVIHSSPILSHPARAWGHKQACGSCPDVTPLPTTSKGCWKAELEASLRPAALAPREASATVTCRPVAGQSVRKQDSRPPGTSGPQTAAPDSRPVPLTHGGAMPAPLEESLCRFSLRAKLLETVVLLLLCLSVFTTVLQPLSPSVHHHL